MTHVGHSIPRFLCTLKNMGITEGHYRPLMRQGATAHACLGAKSRTGLLLDNTNENVTGGDDEIAQPLSFSNLLS